MKRVSSPLSILCMAVLSAFLCACSAFGQNPDTPSLPKAPAFLSPGDRIALISPSYATSDENVAKTEKILRDRGFDVVVGPNVGKVHLGRYAGTLEERLSDMRWALEDPSVKAIICNRGGYGSIHYVDKLPLDELSANPKWIVGYSDVTTFHGMETLAGVMSIHGTMSSHIAEGGDDESSTMMLDLLLGKVPVYKVAPHPSNRPGHASGILVGGNLSTFAPLLGTGADAMSLDGIIIFIEEVEESMHNIDRLFTELEMSGALSRCKGVILGEFTDCGTEYTDLSVEDMLISYIEKYNIPVLCGMPTGHDSVNLPIVMGSVATIDVNEKGGTLSFGLRGRKVTVDTAPIMQRDSVKKAEALAEKQRREAALRAKCKCGAACQCKK